MSKEPGVFTPNRTACEVTCRFCRRPFRVMRLRKGDVRCPTCHRGQGGSPEWRVVEGGQ